jgi:hypothetical protein
VGCAEPAQRCLRQADETGAFCGSCQHAAAPRSQPPPLSGTASPRTQPACSDGARHGAGYSHTCPLIGAKPVHPSTQWPLLLLPRAGGQQQYCSAECTRCPAPAPEAHQPTVLQCGVHAPPCARTGGPPTNTPAHLSARHSGVRRKAPEVALQRSAPLLHKRLAHTQPPLYQVSVRARRQHTARVQQRQQARQRHKVCIDRKGRGAVSSSSPGGSELGKDKQSG